MKPDTIKKIVVIGSGVMGPGIAQTFAQHGYSVHLSDKDKQKLKTGKNIIINKRSPILLPDYRNKDVLSKSINLI